MFRSGVVLVRFGHYVGLKEVMVYKEWGQILVGRSGMQVRPSSILFTLI